MVRSLTELWHSLGRTYTLVRGVWASGTAGWQGQSASQRQKHSCKNALGSFHAPMQWSNGWDIMASLRAHTAHALQAHTRSHTTA
jgi:hypothetical protein